MESHKQWQWRRRTIRNRLHTRTLRWKQEWWGRTIRRMRAIVGTAQVETHISYWTTGAWHARQSNTWCGLQKEWNHPEIYARCHQSLQLLSSIDLMALDVTPTLLQMQVALLMTLEGPRLTISLRSSSELVNHRPCEPQLRLIRQTTQQTGELQKNVRWLMLWRPFKRPKSTDYLRETSDDSKAWTRQKSTLSWDVLIRVLKEGAAGTQGL